MPLPFTIKTAKTTGLSLTVKIKRDVDDLFYDFADDSFKAAGHTTIATPMPEQAAPHPPGNYETADITAATWDDGFYTAYVEGTIADPVELDIVGGALRHDLIDASVSAIAGSVGAPTSLTQTASLQVGEIGFELVLETGRDLTDALTVAVLARKSNQVSLVWAASIVAPATEGRISYTTLSGDVDVPGFWRFQARIVTTGGATLFGEAVQLRVKPIHGL